MNIKKLNEEILKSGGKRLNESTGMDVDKFLNILHSSKRFEDYELDEPENAEIVEDANIAGISLPRIGEELIYIVPEDLLKQMISKLASNFEMNLPTSLIFYIDTERMKEDALTDEFVLQDLIESDLSDVSIPVRYIGIDAYEPTTYEGETYYIIKFDIN